jgi:hypothetical protein
MAGPVARDPFAGSKLGKERLVEATSGSRVEIFNDRSKFYAGSPNLPTTG